MCGNTTLCKAYSTCNMHVSQFPCAALFRYLAQIIYYLDLLLIQKNMLKCSIDTLFAGSSAFSRGTSIGRFILGGFLRCSPEIYTAEPHNHGAVNVILFSQIRLRTLCILSVLDALSLWSCFLQLRTGLLREIPQGCVDERGILLQRQDVRVPTQLEA